MCSNTSLSSGCNGHNNGRVIFSKKPKRGRVPKRGPGVAELEKILREQENSEGFPLFSSFCRSPIHIPSFKSPSKPDHQLSATDLERFSPSKISLSTESSISDTPLRVNNGHVKKSVQIGGSRFFLPEHMLLPTIWNSSDHQYNTSPSEGPKSFPGANQQFSSPRIMQRVQYSPPAIIDGLPHPAATTSTASGPRDSSVEPHSNQASYPHLNSFWPDEDTASMVGTKGCRTYSMDLPDIPAFPIPHLSYGLQTSIIDTSVPHLVNFQPTDAVSRDLKMDGSSESNLRRRENEYGEKRNIPEKERFSFSHLAFQDVKECEETFQRRTAVEKKNKKEQTNFNLNDVADDEEEEAIDLNLKL